MMNDQLGPYQALLFDMDGTLLTSIAAVQRAWGAWSLRNGLQEVDVFAYLHGRRAMDTMRHFLPHLTQADLAVEAAWLDALESQDSGGIAEVPGAGEFLRALPANRWAVVTSANRALAIKRIIAANLPMPQVLIAEEDVSPGKPDPAGYVLAARRLGFAASDCLVLEDAEAGILAGLAAGAAVVQIVGDHQTGAFPVSATLRSYSDLQVRVSPLGLEIFPFP